MLGFKNISYSANPNTSMVTDGYRRTSYAVYKNKKYNYTVEIYRLLENNILDYYIDFHNEDGLVSTNTLKFLYKEKKIKTKHFKYYHELFNLLEMDMFELEISLEYNKGLDNSVRKVFDEIVDYSYFIYLKKNHQKKSLNEEEELILLNYL